MESRKPPVALGLIINKYGNVLAVSRKDDFEDFGFPGGKSEYNEDPETTLRREVYEETGLTVTNTTFLMDQEDKNGYQCRLFLCDYESPNYFDPELGGTTAHDTGKVQWMDWVEFLRRSKSHPDYNLEAFKTFQSRCINPDIAEGKYYMHTRTQEMYHVLHITEDNWVTLRTSYTSRPIVIPTSFIKGRVFLVPKVMYDFSSYITTDMECNPGNYSLADRARIYAIGLHNEVNQDYDDHMYSKHLHDVDDVHQKFKHLIPACDHDIVAAGNWLHDSIEDARKTFNDLKKKFNEDVAEGAYAMTNEKGRARRQRANKKYYDGLLEEKYGEYRKLCDRIANVSNSLINGKMLGGYTQEQAEFKNKLKRNPDYQPMWDYLDNLLAGNIKPIIAHEYN